MAIRRSGVLCHPTSLPSAYGIGDLGSGACQFLAYLAAAGQSVWQVLPLGPTGYGDSPYQPFSAFASNPLLIDPETLVDDGFLLRDDLQMCMGMPDKYVDYGQVIARKTALLYRAYQNYMADADRWAELDQFRSENSEWLDDYALFMALKQRFNWASWVDWPAEIALREPAALSYWQDELVDQITFNCFMQLQFTRQWKMIRESAHAAGIRLLGDMPIFVGHDSADVWAHRELFLLDESGRPTVVAGVPPDYFSPTGQLWGNPIYDWARLRDEGYAWWIQRLRHVLAQVDQVRLDHFRGFAGYWEVPAGESTAIHGRWVRGPGKAFFDVVRQELGDLPIIAEDLGLISADVIALRQELGLPGMRVLQFAFDSDAENVHLPHNWERDLVVYTGTHDNDTLVGWYAQLSQPIRDKVQLYLGSGDAINWALIRLALNSVADTVVIPLQDILGLGSEARLNSPGKPFGNWTWRYQADMLRPELAHKMRQLSVLSGRYYELGSKMEEAKPLILEYKEP